MISDLIIAKEKKIKELVFGPNTNLMRLFSIVFTTKLQGWQRKVNKE